MGERIMRRHLQVSLLFGLLATTTRCQCSEELGLHQPQQAQIDVCVRPTPGATLVCYEDLKVSEHDRLCQGGDTCLLPTLSLDAGDVPQGLGANVEVVVRSV